MKQHDVFRHSDGRIETVKRGWSWPACLFCWFWALAKRMWLLALAVMAANGFVAGFISLLDQLGYPVGVLDSLWMAGILLLQVVFGLYGNAWRASSSPPGIRSGESASAVSVACGAQVGCRAPRVRRPRPRRFPA